MPHSTSSRLTLRLLIWLVLVVYVLVGCAVTLVLLNVQMWINGRPVFNPLIFSNTKVVIDIHIFILTTTLLVFALFFRPAFRVLQWLAKKNDIVLPRPKSETPKTWWELLSWLPPMPEHIAGDYEEWIKHVGKIHQKLSGIDWPGERVTTDDHRINGSLLERQYKMHIDLYEKYLDLLIKFSVFNFATIGAILSFYFANPNNLVTRWALIFPIMMNIFFAVLVLLAYRSLERIYQEVNHMARFLGFLPPGIDTLRQALLISFMLLILIVTGLSIVFDFHPKTVKVYNKSLEGKKSEQAMPPTTIMITTPTPIP